MMKKTLNILLVVCFILGYVSAISEASSMRAVATEVIRGKWYDSNDRLICTIYGQVDGNKGYVDSRGESEIYFPLDNKPARAIVFFDKNDGYYHGDFYMYNGDEWVLTWESLHKINIDYD